MEARHNSKIKTKRSDIDPIIEVSFKYDIWNIIYRILYSFLN